MEKKSVANELQRALAWPFMISSLLLVLYYLTSPFFINLGSSFLDKTAHVLAYIIAISLWITLAWTLNRLIDALIWEGICQSRFAISVPKLIKEILRCLVYFAAMTSMISFLFKKSVVALLTASGAISLIIGFSLNNLIADVFYGLVLSLDKPFLVGDWLQFSHRFLQNVRGQVVEITWRSTYFKTDTGCQLSIPNSMIASMPISNFSQSGFPCFYYQLPLDAHFPIKRALTIIESSFVGIPGILKDPKPKLYVEKLDSGGLICRMFIYYDRSKTGGGSGILKQILTDNLLRNFSLAKLKPGLPEQELQVSCKIR